MPSSMPPGLSEQEEKALLALRKLTPAQERAVEALNLALRAARRAHLVLCGMENHLLAYNGTAFAKLEASGKFPSAYDIQVQLGQGRNLEDRDVYRESGSW